MPLSTFLNNRPPTKLRGLAWLSFSDTAILQTRVSTSDAGGGASNMWNARGTTVCRIYPVTIRGKGALVGGQVNERSTHFCEMPAPTSVSTSDRIVIPTRGTFEVTINLETTDAFFTRVEVIQV